MDVTRLNGSLNTSAPPTQVASELERTKLCRYRPRLPRLQLQRLRKGYPCLTPVSGARLAHAAGFCLEQQRHEKGVTLGVRGAAADTLEATFALTWPKVTEPVRKEWGDPVEATENGACGIAILLVEALTDYHIVHRSYRSTGIDYWLAKREDELLQNAARLEVSGNSPQP